ncbi:MULTISPECIES: bifunctional helix-turn-helix transcriptional regulator/GNAT family N-acetyltransferase [unclassified Sinorhizobium]|uniref:bifunctional helix-turn-helix transcriptional regulator/GNAT family N-acetyltransferase n=1 Tax=unclassified Sinorhizobium TaxID=2613772 RepID=UPI0024C46A2F|nr:MULTISPECIES: bifunctional helix-turn-helix transcriptional regulator/GNAT family N-acetyltransferase [unclassified Sinorhizobium]MDK1374837.1 bifunctional helix-turn-helix transcriptional regulator/GNAT family N-acetyltransferase [Sinorhizobium sp. 6-70]MDK1479021.1 bifunctional helix-turn-helix transcriptional regulator/GNAT family N-acetyltransferase [Sinorhizobium sp. 6-117]
MPQIDREDVAAVRRFSRFYTRRIGLLHEGLLGGPLSLAEGRLVYELAQRKTSTAKELGAELELDSGYLSRLLRGLEERGLVSKSPSQEDGRQVLISLTPAGRESFAAIDARSRDEVSAMLDRLSLPERRNLAAALAEAERLLGGAPEPARVPYILRTHQPGDMGWIVHRHGVLYAQEYGWDETFEALVAQITADFIQNFKPSRERCWVAEREGEIVGSVFLVEESATVGKLRLLYTEPSARGLGIGRRLVEECIRFARQAGYSKVTLWTNDILTAARHIYQTTGFHLVHEEKHHSFGRDLVGQNWELVL